MSDLIEKIQQATARIEELRRVRIEREASANEHERLAKEDRLAMGQAKKEIGELTLMLSHHHVAKGVEDAAAAAQRSKAEAEATLKRLAEKEKELDELIAKAKEPKPE